MENMNELYSDIILEHNQCQENKHPLEDANLSEHGHNPSCGDDITLQADIQDGVTSGVSSAEARRVRELEQEVRELRRANEVLKRAASFFGAELDRHYRK